MHEGRLNNVVDQLNIIYCFLLMSYSFVFHNFSIVINTESEGQLYNTTFLFPPS